VRSDVHAIFGPKCSIHAGRALEERRASSRRSRALGCRSPHLAAKPLDFRAHAPDGAIEVIHH
jgi:hypothetical protein